MYAAGRACVHDVVTRGLSTALLHCMPLAHISALASFCCAGTVSSYAHVMADPCAAPPPAQPPPPALGPKVVFTAGLPGLSVADFGEMQQAAFRAFVQQAAAGVLLCFLLYQEYAPECVYVSADRLSRYYCVQLSFDSTSFILCTILLAAGNSLVIPVVFIDSIVSVTGFKATTMSSGPGVTIRVSVQYPEGTGVTATQFTQQLSGGSTSWLTGQYPGAAVSGVSFADNGAEPPLPPPSPPPPAPPPPAYVPPDALPGTPSLPSDIQVQDIPPGEGSRISTYPLPCSPCPHCCARSKQSRARCTLPSLLLLMFASLLALLQLCSSKPSRVARC